MPVLRLDFSANFEKYSGDPGSRKVIHIFRGSLKPNIRFAVFPKRLIVAVSRLNDKIMHWSDFLPHKEVTSNFLQIN